MGKSIRVNVKMENARCDDCQWYRPMNDLFPENNGEEYNGICQRHPPIAIVDPERQGIAACSYRWHTAVPIFPRVHGYDICGDFEVKDDEKFVSRRVYSWARDERDRFRRDLGKKNTRLIERNREIKKLKEQIKHLKK